MQFFQKYWIVSIALLLLSIGGCKDYSEVELPNLQLDKEDITYVAVGNSITAGMQNDALYEQAQRSSFPALLARQMRVEPFEQPLISSPGLSERGRIEVVNLQTLETTRVNANGQPVNTGIGHPYHNLGVPGAEVGDYLNNQNTLSNRDLYPVIVNTGSPQNPLPSMHSAVKELQPDIVTFWLGNNSILEFTTSGGLQPFTNPQTFQSQYTNAIGAIESLNSDPTTIVLNIPSIQSIPFATTLGPRLKEQLQPAQDVPGIVVQKTFYEENQAIGASENRKPAGLISKTDLSNPSKALILLTARNFLPLLGATAGTQNFQPIKQYWIGFLQQAGVDGASQMTTDELEQTLTDLTIQQYEQTFGTAAATQFAQQYPGFEFDKPFGFDLQNPFPNQFVLGQNEINITQTVTGIYNATIAQHGDVQIDIHGVFNQIISDGQYSNSLTEEPLLPIIGSLFSLDGIHPSNKAHGVIANKIIQKMNASLNSDIPKVTLKQIPLEIPVEDQ